MSGTLCCNAAIILYVCPRCSGSRTAATPPDRGHYIGRPRHHGPDYRAAIRIGGSLLPSGLTGRVANRRSVDPYRRCTGRAQFDWGDFLAHHLLAAVCLRRNHCRGSRPSGTGGVVGRCPALWLEANKDFRSESQARPTDVISNGCAGAKLLTQNGTTSASK